MDIPQSGVPAARRLTNAIKYVFILYAYEDQLLFDLQVHRYLIEYASNKGGGLPAAALARCKALFESAAVDKGMPVSTQIQRCLSQPKPCNCQ